MNPETNTQPQSNNIEPLTAQQIARIKRERRKQYNAAYRRTQREILKLPIKSIDPERPKLPIAELLRIDNERKMKRIRRTLDNF